jgi:hypothetical protein
MYNFARKGYYAEGCDMSFYMQIGYNFIMNHCKAEEQFSCHPYIHAFFNQYKLKDIMKEIKIPDVDPRKFADIKDKIVFKPKEFIKTYSK